MVTKSYHLKNIFCSLMTVAIVFVAGATTAAIDKNTSAKQSTRPVPQKVAERLPSSVALSDKPMPRTLSNDLGRTLACTLSGSERRARFSGSVCSSPSPISSYCTSLEEHGYSCEDTHTFIKCMYKYSNSDEFLEKELHNSKSKEIDEVELKELILSGEYSSEEHYLTGNITFTNESRLKKLPDNLTAQTIRIENCKKFKTLPENLRVKDLYISGCPIAGLSETLRVDGIASIIDCNKLKKLPECSFVKEKLTISYCSQLENLGKKFVLHGELNINNCANLTCVATDILIVSSFIIDNNHKLNTLARLILNRSSSIEHNSVVRNCNELTSIAQKLKIRGDFTVYNCPKVMHLAEMVAVRGDLNIDECNNVTTLATNWLAVTGEVITNHLPKFIRLHDGDPLSHEKIVQINKDHDELPLCEFCLKNPNKNPIKKFHFKNFPFYIKTTM